MRRLKRSIVRGCSAPTTIAGSIIRARRGFRVAVVWGLLSAMSLGEAHGEARTLDDKLHHLRNGNREWTEFPQDPEAGNLLIAFDAKRNDRDSTLRFRQQDVKQSWTITLNDRQLGQLTVDENDMVLYVPVPAGTVKDGENQLRIEQTGSKNLLPDDIRVGEFVLDDRPIAEVLGESRLTVQVTDSDLSKPTPCRITILRHDGALQQIGTPSNEQLAVRAGVVYSLTGQVELSLPAGDYQILAGRGFEYSLDSANVKLTANDKHHVALKLRREVPTEGYVACDTHLHTLTYSGHGDATIIERMVTLAGEGIELPVAADHNVQIDYRPFAEQSGARRYFTPIIGNEVTTRVGHFNVFPLAKDSPPPNHRLESWSEIFAEIKRQPGTTAIILNHARDLHSNTRPFGAKLHHPTIGMNLAGWEMGFNAMEVINSGATQTDHLQLIRDWMAVLNRNLKITPVGGSDSHDVARHFVGQARTYIRARDDDPSNINTAEALKNFLDGHVRVSYGLLTELTVQGKATSGDVATVPEGETVSATVRVLAPHWIAADKICLFQNGKLIREINVDDPSGPQQSPGVKWSGEIKLDRPPHDVHLVAVATGPGVTGSHWKTAKPYQPTSPDWTPRVIGCSGAVWLDVDGDRKATSAYEYAQRAIKVADVDLGRLLKALEKYDEAVTAQAAHLYQSSRGDLLSDDSQRAVSQAAEPVRVGFQSYLEGWREWQKAQAGE